MDEKNRSKGNNADNRSKKHQSFFWNKRKGGALKSDSADTTVTTDVLERRRQRFSKKPEAKEFGLISRGDDLTLKYDAEARESLFNDCLLSIKLFKGDDPSERDHILMMLRKLRESVLACVSDPQFTIDTKFANDVLFKSIQFSASVGHRESYIPAMNQMINNEYNSNSTQLRIVKIGWALHLSHFERATEDAFAIFIDATKDTTKCAIYELINRILIANTCDLSLDWLVAFKELSKLVTADDDTDAHEQKIYMDILNCTGVANHVKNSLKIIEKAYRQIPLRLLEEWTGIQWDKLASEYNLGWSIDGTVVSLRAKKKN